MIHLHLEELSLGRHEDKPSHHFLHAYLACIQCVARSRFEQEFNQQANNDVLTMVVSTLNAALRGYSKLSSVTVNDPNNCEYGAQSRFRSKFVYKNDSSCSKK